jgi:hypothetical protein
MSPQPYPESFKKSLIKQRTVNMSEKSIRYYNDAFGFASINARQNSFNGGVSTILQSVCFSQSYKFFLNTDCR